MLTFLLVIAKLADLEEFDLLRLRIWVWQSSKVLEVLK